MLAQGADLAGAQQSGTDHRIAQQGEGVGLVGEDVLGARDDCLVEHGMNNVGGGLLPDGCRTGCRLLQVVLLEGSTPLSSRSGVIRYALRRPRTRMIRLRPKTLIVAVPLSVRSRY